MIVLGWLSDPFKGLSDLQRSGIKRSRLESAGGDVVRGFYCFPTFRFISSLGLVILFGGNEKKNQVGVGVCDLRPAMTWDL